MIPQKNHPQVESRAIYCLLLAIGLNRACSLVPDYTFDPFLFYDIQISVGYYIYALSNHCFVMILFYILAAVSSRMYQLMAQFFWLEVLSLVDFILIYEHPIFYICGYGVEFTDLKIILYVILIIQWKNKQSS
jgi:hypothetical protein